MVLDMNVKQIKVISREEQKEVDMAKQSAFYELKVEEQHEDTPNKNIPYISLYRKLARDTTGHGLPHINDARGICKISTWMFITVAAVAWMVYHCYSIIYTYAKFEVSVALSIETKNQLDFPAVTVCNLNPYRYSQLNSILKDILDNKGTKKAQWQDRDKDEYGEYGFDEDIDEDLLAFQWATEIIAETDAVERRELGHQLEDLIQMIQYNGYHVPLRTLDYTYNWKYGNCFTFNSGRNGSVPIVRSATTGPQWGLTMIFNVEQSEYVPDFTTVAGVRVLVHDQTRTPFPEEDGIDIPLGFSTSIGLRMTQISRLDGRFGNCTKLADDHSSSSVYEAVFPWHNYTLKGCMKTCYQKKLMALCDCYDYKYLHKGGPFPDDNRVDDVCNMDDDSEETCATNIEQKFKDGSLTCVECSKPCQETLFSMTLSQSSWPSKKARQLLLDELSSDHTGAQTIINSGDFDDNFAQVQIYYEELNFQSISESPSYEFGQFASDLGGAVGLWVGASVITCFEYIEYILDLLVLWISKSNNKNTRSETDNSFSGNNAINQTGTISTFDSRSKS